MALRLTMAFSDNPRVQPLKDGTVKPQNIDLECVTLDPSALFQRNLLYDEFDVSEMSISETLLAIERRDGSKWDWSALPVFLSRGHVWPTLYVNTASGITSLADLKGKRIGVPDYDMTAALWFLDITPQTAICISERFQIGDFLDQAEIGAGMLDLGGFVLGEAADVRFINDRFADVAADVAIPFPVEIVIDDDALGRADDAIGRRKEVAGQGLGIRIDQPGGAVEPLALLGVVRAVGLEVIELADADAGDEDAPNVAPAVGLAVEFDHFFRVEVQTVS